MSLERRAENNRPANDDILTNEQQRRLNGSQHDMKIDQR